MALANATTVLNLGTGGDSMDESAVTQVAADGTETSTKRARVTLGADDGGVIGALPTPRLGTSPVVPTSDVDAGAALQNIERLLTEIHVLLLHALSDDSST